MQILKDEVRKLIIDESRKEFFDNGFQAASMRSISLKADVGLSNIYNYFKNKDDIFCVILNPLIEEIDHVLADYKKASVDDFRSPERLRKFVVRHIGQIKKHSELMKLLLYRSQGSSLESFRDDFTDKATKIIMELLEKEKINNPKSTIDVSEFFVHAFCAWEIAMIGEVLTHHLTARKLDRFIDEYVNFSTSGWSNLLGK